jgi:AcrR family transcriptional regulator
LSGAPSRTTVDERDALIEAMAECLAERGYEATSLELVAAAAGRSVEDLDRYFTSKEECALAAVETILADGMSTVSEAYSPDTSEGESAFGALHALLGLFAARPPFARLAFIDSRQAMPVSALQRYESGFAILTAMLDRLREAGGEPQPPPTAARAAIGGGEALVRRELVAQRPDRLPAILPNLVYGATVGFLGQEQALRLARSASALLPPDQTDGP